MTSQATRNSSPSRATITSAIAAVSMFRWNQLPAARPALAPIEVAAAVNPGHQRQAEHRQQEERRQRVDFEVQPAARHRPARGQALGLTAAQRGERRGKPECRAGDSPGLTESLGKSRAEAQPGGETAAQPQYGKRH